MVSFINKPIIRELIGSLAFAVVFIGAAPMIADHLEATKYVQDLYHVKTIGEYIDVTRGENTSQLNVHVRACYEILAWYIAPSMIFDASALAEFVETRK